MSNDGVAVRGRVQRGIQSVEVGGRLLQTLAHHGRPMALKDLAADAGMSAAKAHPYLVSFGHIGILSASFRAEYLPMPTGVTRARISVVNDIVWP